MRVLVCCLGTAALLGACSDRPAITALETPPAAQVTEPLFATLYSNIHEPRRLLITDDASWSALWAQMVVSAGAPATPPRVDFARENVLVAAMGERHSAGYAIRITDVVNTGDGLLAFVTSTVPAGSCAAADVITTPLDAVRVPKSAEPIVFDERTLILGCS